MVEAEQKRVPTFTNQKPNSMLAGSDYIGSWAEVGIPRDTDAIQAEQEAAVAQGLRKVRTDNTEYQWPDMPVYCKGNWVLHARLDSVNDIVGDRLLLTVLISLGSLLLTWAIALPAGIYSAVHQYKMSDYVLGVLAYLAYACQTF